MAEKVKKKAIKKTITAKRTAATENAQSSQSAVKNTEKNAQDAAKETVTATAGEFQTNPQAATENDDTEVGSRSEHRHKKLSKRELTTEIIRKIIFCIALGAFTYSATGLAVYAYGYYSSAQEYKEINEEGGVTIETMPAESETETETDADGGVINITPVESVPKVKFTVDESYFKSVNSDYVCYLYIPGESDDDSLTYPVVLGTDNEHYLRYTYRNTENMGGAICMDFRTDRDDPLGAGNTVIWGHDRKDGSMFGYLLKYKDEEYAKKYPYIYIYMDGQVYAYRIFAFYPTSPYGIVFSPLSNTSDVIEQARELNWYSKEINIEDEENAKILTLYTCTEDATKRYILEAQLMDVYSPE